MHRPVEQHLKVSQTGVATTPARRPICFAMGVAARTRHQRWAPVVLLALVVGLQAAACHSGALSLGLSYLMPSIHVNGGGILAEWACSSSVSWSC